MSNQETATYQTTFERILAEQDAGLRCNPGPAFHGLLEMNKIHVAPLLFQPRGGAFISAESEDHVRELMTAIFGTTGNILDPVLVWWSGKQWYLIDGHHRLAAYRRCAKEKKWETSRKIPVKVFTGSLDDAELESAKLNAKDKLKMTRKDKFERAWHFTGAKPHLSKKTVASVCAVANSTVANMRATLKQLEEAKQENPEDYPESFLEWSWEEAKKGTAPERTYDDAWDEMLEKEWAKRLTRVFGNETAKHSDRFGRSIARHSQKTLKGLEDWMGIGTRYIENPKWDAEADF